MPQARRSIIQTHSIDQVCVHQQSAVEPCILGREGCLSALVEAVLIDMP